jgi:hypothetical protein
MTDLWLFVDKGKIDSISSKNNNEEKVSITTALIQYGECVLSHSNKKEKKKRNTGVQVEKAKVELSLFANDMMLYPRDPKVCTRKFLYVINIFF